MHGFTVFHNMYLTCHSQAVIKINRKMLQELALHEPISFEKVVEEARAAREKFAAEKLEIVVKA